MFCWQVEGPYQQSGLRWSEAWCRCPAAWRPPRRTTSCWWRWSGLRRWCQISTPQSAIHREKTWNNTWIQFPAEEGPSNVLCTGCELEICSQRNWEKRKEKGQDLDNYNVVKTQLLCCCSLVVVIVLMTFIVVIVVLFHPKCIAGFYLL